jgi:hypothetical protein
VLGSYAEAIHPGDRRPDLRGVRAGGPHAPATPEARFTGAFDDLPPWRPPSFDEADVTDKPSSIRDLPRLDEAARQALDTFRLAQYRTLLSVDATCPRP